MKILKLEFENINSYRGHFCIDFTDPLYEKNYNQFVICGPTASGKTTILDVITLALYGRTPRQSINGKGNEVMNKESWFCKASITYTAAKGTYTGTFYQARGYKKIDGNLQAPLLTLVLTGPDGEEEVVASEKDVKKYAEETEKVIGLNYDQFVRTILIPQGEFSKFLASDDYQKAAILARISRTGHYKKMGEYLWDQWKALDQKKVELEKQVKDYPVMTAEEVGERSAEKEQKSDRVRELSRAGSELQKQIEHIRAVDTAEKKLGEAEASLRKCTAEEASFAPMKDVLARAERAVKCREAYGKWQDAEKAVSDEQGKLQAAEQEIQGLKEKLDLAGRKVDETKELLETEQRKEPELSELWKKVRDLDTKAQTEGERVKERSDAYIAAKAQLEKKKERLIQLTEEKGKLKEALERSEAYLRENQKDEGITTVTVILGEEKKTIRSTMEAKTASEAQIRKLLGEKEKAEGDFAKLNGEVTQLTAQLAGLMDREAVMLAGILSRTLEEGKPCPVCGSTVHRVHGEQSRSSDEELLVVKNVAALNDRLKQAEEKQSGRKAEIDRLTQDLERERTACDDALKKLDSMVAEIHQSVGPWEMKLRSEEGDLTEQIDRMILMLNKRKADFDKARKEQEQATRELVGVEKEMDTIDLPAAEKDADAAKENYESKNALYQELLDQRKKLFGEKKPDQEEERFKKDLGKKQQSYDEACESLNRVKLDMNTAETTRKNCGNRLGELKPQVEEAKSHFEAALKENGFASTQAFRECLKSDEELQQLKDREKKLEQRRTEAGTAYGIAKDDREKLGERGTDKNINELVLEKDGLDTEMTKLNQEIGGIENALSANLEALKKRGEIQQDLERILKKKEVFDRIKGMIGKADGAAFETFVQRKLAMRNLLSKANDYMKLIQPEYCLVQKGDTMDILVQEEDVIRPISNASGGETFCISLALALAMAEFAGKGNNVGALFLDEGFGTLSGDPLSAAIVALQNLGQEDPSGKLLGIITHVEPVIHAFDLKMEAKKVRKRSVLTGPGVSRIVDDEKKEEKRGRKKKAEPETTS